MILKRMTATGFKSFADKTEFDFGPGITCIVGPNGCGKSNVVDAIKWVLGEQSAKSLRGKQMMDVIFNGSGTRKSSGMAQVDLTFDNADGTLPTDQTEVTVTRRLYRSGESEYLLNKQACRLKDIREMFLDTGIGVSAYSVIEQGRVDAFLQASPTDRRNVFEEAAGISKYKMRKKEALRRLERVDQNLQRVTDIVEEVEKRLRSVKLAAGKARNYQSYTQELRELRSRYALAEFHRLHTRQQELDRAISEFSDEATRIRTALSENEAQSSHNNVRIVDLERELSEAEKRLLTVQSQITAHEERIAAAERRIADQTDLLKRSEERLAGFDEQMSGLDRRLNEQNAASQQAQADAEQVNQELSRLGGQERAYAAELTQMNHALEDEKSGIINLLRRTSQLRNEISGLNLQHESVSKQKEKLDERDAVIANELTQSLDRQSQLKTRLDEVEQLLTDQRQKLSETKQRIERVNEHRARLLDQIAAAKEYRSGLHSRRTLLEEMDRRHEGVLIGAREILERRDATATTGSPPPSDAATVDPQAPSPTPQAFSYVLGAVGELFEADVAHAGLVEAVLGPHESWLVVTEQSRLIADRDALNELSGQVRAFCLDRTPAPIGGADIIGHDGVIARLLDWVRFPDSCAKLARCLLGRTYVVETLDHVWELSKVDSGARFVTLEGVVVEPDGRVAAGPLGRGAGLISRRSEMRELDKQLAETAERIETLQAELKESETQAGHLEQVHQQLQSAIHEASNQRVQTQTQLSTVDESVRRLSAERPIIAAEVSVLVGRLQEMREKEAAGQRTLCDLEDRNAEMERMVEQLTAQIAGAGEARRMIGEQITAARVRAGELNQRRSAILDNIRQLEASKSQLQADRDKAMHDVTEARQRIEQSHRQIEGARQTLGELTVEQTELTDRSQMFRRERDGLRDDIERLTSEARNLRGRLEQTESQLHERQMTLQEVRVRREDLVDRITQELSVNLEEQYQTYQPDADVDWDAVEVQINELRAKIERLGNVNLDAITEQEELENRLKFLTEQLDDLRNSEKQLAELIERLNTESTRLFLETFEAVKGHFAAIFKKLFGGGKAEIILENPEDVLESGIQITARPPGKEPQSISLLSGGEKTMTALSLLMAVYRSRPSPFVLLDEVDAALDEANNIRFNHLIQEYVSISQFIVITHSKRTMSIGDVMYGVTMQEAGVSKRVSVRLTDEHEHAESAVA